MSFSIRFKDNEYNSAELRRLCAPWLSWAHAIDADVLLVPVEHDFDSVLKILAAIYSGKKFCPISAIATESEWINYCEVVRHVGEFARMPEMPGKAAAVNIAANPGDLIIFTSGSTGNPKGVVQPWTNVLAAAKSFQVEHGITPEDSWLLSLPLSHIGGLSILLRGLILEHQIVLAIDRSVDSLRTHILEDRITGISLVPTQLRNLLQEKASPARPCRLLIGGAALFEGLRERATAAGFSIFESYGATETCAQVVNNKAPHPAVEIRLGEGQEILISGPMVADTYLTALGPGPVKDSCGFWHSGDIGSVDENGNLSVIGKTKDLINTGGIKVAPAEIERAILSHPRVSDAAVFGIPDSYWGERVVALVVSDSEIAEGDLKIFLRDRISSIKVPKEIRQVGRIPTLASGKVSRSFLAEQFNLRIQ